MGTTGIQDSVLQKEIRELKSRIAELESEGADLRKEIDLLRRSSNLFETLGKNMKEVFWVHDVERKRLEYVSPGYEKVWERSYAELTKNPWDWMQAIHPEDQKRIFEALKTKQHLGTYDEEYRIVLPNGTIRWIHDRAYPIKNESGNIYKIAGIAEDITERKQSQLALVESENKFIQIVDHLKQVLWLYCFNARKNLYVSPAYETVWGRSCESVYENPRSWVDAVHPQDRDHVVQTCFVQRPSDDFTIEFRIQCPDETIKWIRNRIFTIRNDKGEVYRLAGVAEDITLEKKAKDDLLLSEHRYRVLVETFSHTVFLIQNNGKADRANIQWWMDISGQTEEESRADGGFGWVNALHPDDRERTRKAWAHAIKNTEKFDCEYRVLTPKNDYKHFSVQITPVKSPVDNSVEWVGSINDITDRKKAEESIRAQQMELQLLFDVIPAFVWIKDANNHILKLNKKAADFMGRKIEDIQGKSTDEIHPKEASQYHKDDLEVIRSGKPKLGIVEKLTSRSGEHIWIETSKVPFYDSAGNATGVVVHSQDITERIKTQDVIKEKESRLRALVNAIPDKMLRIRKDGTILDSKLPKGSKHFPTTTLNGLNLRNVLTTDVYEHYMQEITRVLKDKEIRRFEYRLTINKAIHDYEARFVNVDENEVVVIIRNMTEYRKLENEMLEFSESYKQRIGQDLHDGLGQHLTGISFLTKVLYQKLESLPKLEKEADEAQRIVNYVNEAINRTRNMAKGLYPVELEKDGLCSAAREMASQTEKLFSVQCKFKSTVSDELINTTTSNHLYQIIQEAIHNAVKHGKAQQIDVRLEQKGEKVALSIRDDGTGFINQNKKARGMGLEIIKHRCRAIGATYEIANLKPRGAVVSAIFNPSSSSVKVKRYAKP